MVPIELIILIFALILVISIVWGTLRTGISPMMSSGQARQAMLDCIREPHGGQFIDLGSGWGTLVIPLAQKYPGRQVIGYELSFLPWCVSVVRKYCLGLHNLTLYRRDFKSANLDGASVLFCYLHPGGMLSLQEKLEKEGAPGMVIISNTFALPSAQPIDTIQLDDLYRTLIYKYSWGAGGARGQ